MVRCRHIARSVCAGHGAKVLPHRLWHIKQAQRCLRLWNGRNCDLGRPAPRISEPVTDGGSPDLLGLSVQRQPNQLRSHSRGCGAQFLTSGEVVLRARRTTALLAVLAGNRSLVTRFSLSELKSRYLVKTRRPGASPGMIIPRTRRFTLGTGLGLWPI
ncbi:MAG: hypothetical protein USCAAHI_00050 [Beijerinckiaceae bacterium]|nr:MAG: hypothetical protein USCAAHI_00050 [Beijerinckiaceae bacterium]